MSPISGGDSGGVPPLPIPNREVKPACADGTAMQCGRVGSCLLYLGSSRSNDFGDLFLCLGGTVSEPYHASYMRGMEARNPYLIK